MKKDNKITHFNIHNLVSVKIDADVASVVKEQIMFQIGFFETETKEESTQVINIFPYKKYMEESGDKSIYYSNFYNSGLVVNISKEYFAIEKHNNGFNIYTDTPILINLFIQLLLFKKGFTFIHAAGVVNESGEAILFPASGGVGKTAILGTLMRNENYKLLGDDLVLINKDGYCLAFPRPFILKKYHKDIYPEVFKKLGYQKNILNLNLKSAFKFFLQNAPFYHFAVSILKRKGYYSTVVNSLPLPHDYVAAVDVEDIFGKDCVMTEQIKVKKIHYMERFHRDVFKFEEISKESITTRMFSVIHDEWHEQIRNIFMFGATEIINLPDYYSEVSESISQVVKKCDTSLIKIPKSASPKRLAEFYRSYE